MKRATLLNFGSFVVIFCFAVSVSSAAANPAPLDQNGIANVFGKKGEMMEQTYKMTFPRADLHVTAHGVTIKPGFALGSWAGFAKAGESAVTYGDLVVLEKEVNPVISKLMEYGIETIALHNHLIYENPRVMYIHFLGRGNEVNLAQGLKEAFALTGTPMKAPPTKPEAKSDTAKNIEAVLGYQGTLKSGVLSIGVPRKDLQIKTKGAHIPGNMGMNIPLNFQLDGSRATINGDFLLLADEVNAVIKALRDNNIEVTALHNHMLDEEPRIFFMHFWAVGDGVTLAKGLKAALDKTAVKK